MCKRINKRATDFSASMGFTLLYCIWVWAGPTLSVSPRIIDFGFCGHREKLSKELSLRNSGDKLLRIYQVRTSCDCTKIYFQGRKVSPYGRQNIVLPPKQEASFQVVMNTGRATGVLHKYIEIRSSDPSKPVVRIPVIAKVHHNIRTLPWSLPSFSAIAEGPPVLKVVKVLFISAPLTEPPIKALKANKPCVKVKLERLGDSELKQEALRYKQKYPRSPYSQFRVGYRIHITVEPPAEEGFFSAVISAQINGKYWEYPVHGYIFRGILVEPRYFQFGAIVDPSNLERSIKLKSADGIPFDIIEVQSNPPILSFRVESSKDRLVHKVYARIKVVDRSRPFFSKVKILTTHPKKRSLTVSCLGFWKKKRK